MWGDIAAKLDQNGAHSSRIPSDRSSTGGQGALFRTVFPQPGPDALVEAAAEFVRDRTRPFEPVHVGKFPVEAFRFHLAAEKPHWTQPELFCIGVCESRLPFRTDVGCFGQTRGTPKFIMDRMNRLALAGNSIPIFR